MSLAGTARSVVELLRAEYLARHGSVGAPSFSVMAPQMLSDALTNQVTLLVYRVEQDPSRRYSDLPPSHPGGPRRTSLRLDLRFLLTAWMTDGEGELEVLERCMAILDDHPFLSGTILDPTYTWEPETRLSLTLDHLGMEDALRLWDALSPSFRLSVPYVVRTIRISPTDQPVRPPVDTSTTVYTTMGEPS